METVLSEYAAKAKLAGFRTGKAPRDLVRGMFLEEIRKDAADSLVPKAFEEEIKAAGLRPASVPVVRDAHYEDDGTLHAGRGLRGHAGIRPPGLYRHPPGTPGTGRRGQGARSRSRGPSPAGRRIRARGGKGSGRRGLRRRRDPGTRLENEESLSPRKGRRSRRALRERSLPERASPGIEARGGKGLHGDPPGRPSQQESWPGRTWSTGSRSSPSRKRSSRPSTTTWPRRWATSRAWTS